ILYKKLFNSKYFDAIVLTAASCLNLIFGIIVYSVKLSPDWGGKSIWSTGTFGNELFSFQYFSLVFTVVFFIGLALTALSILLIFLKNNKIAFFVSLPYNILLNLVLLFLHFGLNFLQSGAVACIIIGIIISSAQLIYAVVRRITNKETTENAAAEFKVKNPLITKLIVLICQILTAVLSFIVFFIPLYSVINDQGETQSYKLIQALSISFLEESFPIALYVSFIALFVAFLASLIFFIANVRYFFKSDGVYLKKSKQYIYGNVVFLLVYFIVGYCICFSNNLNEISSSTVSYIPLICSLIVLTVFSVVQGKVEYILDGAQSQGAKKLKIESLIYVVLLTLITFVSLFLNMIEIHTEIGSFKDDVAMTGYKLLTTYGELGEGLQTLAFVLFAVLVTSGTLFVFTLVSFFTKYNGYSNVVRITAIANVVFVLLFGLSGIYFKIAQAINAENIESILEYYEVSALLAKDYTYTVTSKAIYMFIASFIVLIVMLVRKQFSLEKPQTEPAGTDVHQRLSFGERATSDLSPVAEADFDACPAFTELDSKMGIYDGDLAKRWENIFPAPTLPNLVRFVVNYARESRLHLSYSLEDIATFVAGLGASRLTILQGMSGTGKTSLPKIFAEALMGNCEIVEVESSWRDKNELLGYYNEFSKCFTPKKFTQCLYKAKLNSSVPTFIVLDEMNLSRIEYYFSDFLSLMEHEEDKREIKLLNVKLYRTENGEKKTYSALTDGHTVKIPPNVWFIGTANRDESTFEISDKVYDRAQTMNFNKRAPKIQSFGEPLSPKFINYNMLTNLFENAKSGFQFDAESNTVIQKVEKLLVPYNISFGNRILRQMEDFVKIYCACFTDRDGVIKEAVEKILLSKVVCKLEYKIVENKEALAADFDKLGLTACSEFIRKLNED
ncbi:MAG: hypothetical protein K2J83_02760, partial [Clostridia bacterium]|nr:hypothetical protein [Clostridia bacterium]